MPLIGLGQDALEHDISSAPSARVGRDIEYAFTWAGPRCFRPGPLQLGLAEIYNMPGIGLGQDALKHDISRAPSAGVS